MSAANEISANEAAAKLLNGITDKPTLSLPQKDAIEIAKAFALLAIARSIRQLAEAVSRPGGAA